MLWARVSFRPIANIRSVASTAAPTVEEPGNGKHHGKENYPLEEAIAQVRESDVRLKHIFEIGCDRKAAERHRSAYNPTEPVRPTLVGGLFVLSIPTRHEATMTMLMSAFHPLRTLAGLLRAPAENELDILFADGWMDR